MDSAGRSASPPSVVIDFEVVDGDGHTILPSDEWWKPYLPQRYWDWAPRNVRTASGGSELFAEGRFYTNPLPLPGGATMSGAGGGAGVSSSLMIPGAWRLADLTAVPIEEARRRGGASPEDRLRAMDEDGVAIAYMYPSELLSLPYALKSAAFAAALVQAYNDWLAEYCARDPNRLRGVALVPQQDLILASEEMERAREKGFRAIMLRPNPVAGQNLDHPNYDRLWAAAQDLDIAIGVHEGFGVDLPRLGVDRCSNWLQAHAAEHPFEHMSATMLLITSGVLQRFPRLRVGFLENGAGWAGFWLHHLDEHYEKWARFYPGLAELPSVYFKRQCFLGVEPDYALIPHLIDCGLADTLVFSTDFPHFDAIFPGSVAALAGRKDISAEHKRKALRDNALRLYGADT